MTTFAQALADMTGDDVVVDVDDAGDLVLELRPGRAASWAAAASGPGGSQDLAQVLAQGGDPDGNAITGPLIIQPAAGNDASFRVLAPAGMVSNFIVKITSEEGGVGGLNVLKGGGTILDGAGQAGGAALEVGASTTGALTIWDRDFNNEILTVGPTGAVTMEQLDATGARTLTVKHDDVGNGFEVLRVADGDDNAMLTVDTAGSCAVQLFTAGGLFSVYDVTGSKAVLTVGQSEIGFFTQAPVAQPTGVAVSAAGIHAALVSLGLITA